ncbi:fatty acyl-AMP ligase [Lichenibacterium dinghuense]|uniref:fatty acyl-AMP ligase n=1 Tax=Lichenibacterium dinghuense TaxID=2895977 RepID=UPI001F2DF812|nr:fatty acyl-AMP ligase [Lichenibacterium sp. 6Y81]
MTTVVESLREHARLRPDAEALFFTRGEGEPDVLTYGELDRRARAFAGRLAGAVPADRPLLLALRSDAGSVVALFGCLYAGVPCAPVPLPPRNGSLRRLQAFAEASRCAAVVTPGGADLPFIAPGVEVIRAEEGSGDANQDLGLPRAADLAFVQYTSGSVSAPKGVMLTHANVVANLGMLRTAFGVAPGDRFASWLPLFHDMGLAMLLMPLYFGVPGVLMPPLSFLRRPEAWLSVVGQHRATITGAPNFAFEACARRVPDAVIANLDLRHLRLAFCGAEPVRLATLRHFARRFAPTGFRAEALYPCYGMAEAVTFVSGDYLSRADAEGTAEATDPALTARCGAPAVGSLVAIADPETLQPRRDGEEGEIWISGPHVGVGYLGLADATRAAFGARLAAHPGRFFLRTGDLGVLRGGVLTVTGRIKDVIVHRGEKIHAADVEATVAACHPSFGDVGAAFAREVDGTEAVVLVQEVARGLAAPPVAAMHKAALEAVALYHGVRLHEVVLVRAGSLPKTSSGKVRREACRASYLRSLESVIASVGDLETSVAGLVLEPP